METENVKEQVNGVKEHIHDVKEQVKNSLKKATNFNPLRKEGKVAKAIESQTARIPSDVFLWSFMGTMAASFALKMAKRDHSALFVGLWAAPFLLLGIYNKIVKLEGHDNATDAKKVWRRESLQH
jgi:hypothetical protein